MGQGSSVRSALGEITLSRQFTHTIFLQGLVSELKALKRAHTPVSMIWLAFTNSFSNSGTLLLSTQCASAPAPC